MVALRQLGESFISCPRFISLWRIRNGRAILGAGIALVARISSNGGIIEHFIFNWRSSFELCAYITNKFNEIAVYVPACRNQYILRIYVLIFLKYLVTIQIEYSLVSSQLKLGNVFFSTTIRECTNSEIIYYYNKVQGTP